jgi:cobalt-precorrin-5B (C1)-methyltransferase
LSYLLNIIEKCYTYENYNYIKMTIVNQLTTPRSGYTLPVFAAASAVAAVKYLTENRQEKSVSLDLIQPQEIVEIPIEQVAKINDDQVLAITRSDPGDNFDLTRNTPIWALVGYINDNKPGEIVIKGGEGIGKLDQGDPAIYAYAKKLLITDLKSYFKPDQTLEITLILPEGKNLAKRTSNEAFGVVEGLSLLGTSGVSQPVSAAGQLAIYQQELLDKAQQFKQLVFCIGENGLDLAQKLGIDPQRLVKTGNWLGSLLVTAAIANLDAILLFGYHGKLIKLAGGIFHTHHHIADGRLEILTAIACQIGLPLPILQKLYQSPTAEDGLQLLRELDQQQGSQWEKQVYQAIASKIDQRSQDYIAKHTEQPLKIGSILFDRKRNIIAQSEMGTILLNKVAN